jgi:peptidoglycan/LPS O-acetylase OafA/YrhL
VVSEQQRLSHLDGLRGVAVLSVVGFHSYLLVPSLAGKVLPGGFLGVDLFFVLSGFLMTSILLGHGSRGQFLVRRAVRILPALYLLLGAQLLYTCVLGDPLGSDLRAVVPMALGVGNWNQTAGVVVPLSLTQTWSLGIEEQFYVLWPVALMLFCWRKVNLKVCVVAGILASGLTRLLLACSGVPIGTLYSQTECRLDALLVGALVALLWRDRWLPALLPLVTVPAALFLLWALEFAHPDSMWLYDGGFTAVAVACGVLVLACVNGIDGLGVFTSGPLRVCGRFSYSAYLWHTFVFFALLRGVPHETMTRVCVGTVLLVMVAVLSTLLVEEPLRRRVAARLTTPRSRPPERLSATMVSA